MMFMQLARPGFGEAGRILEENMAMGSEAALPGLHPLCSAVPGIVSQQTPC